MTNHKPNLSLYVPQTYTLSNGLRVVYASSPHLARAHVSLYVRVGSRYEDKKTNGLSHFLEHMIYRGMPSHKSAHLVNDAFESLGSVLYAATEVDLGVFSLSVPPEHLAQSCELFSALLARPLFTGIEIEKQIVCEEILEDLDENLCDVNADNQLHELLFGDHPLSFPIAGTASLVRSFEKEDLFVHHAKHYTATSSVLVFSGNIPGFEEGFDRCNSLEKSFLNLLSAQNSLVLPERFKLEPTPPRFRYVEYASNQVELRLGFLSSVFFGLERAAADMVLRILDDGMSTRLYHRVVDDLGLCYDVNASYETYEDCGLFSFSASVQSERVGIVLGEFFALCTHLKNHLVSDLELTKAKNRVAWNGRDLRDHPEEVAEFYGRTSLFHPFSSTSNAPAQNLETWLSERQAVTAEELQLVSKRLFQFNQMGVVCVGSLRKEEQKQIQEIMEQYI